MVMVCHQGEWKQARWDKGHVGVWLTCSNGEDYWFNMASFDAYCFDC